MSPSPSIVAIVVTYNRLALLKECIDALRSQTYPLAKIAVINNSSTDGTFEWLSEQSDIVVITQENKGGAAGFYTGLDWGFSNKYDWIWCMDDDGKPATDALERLMVYENEAPCVINALVLDKDDPSRMVFKTGPYTLAAQIPGDKVLDVANFFNGTLIHRTIIEKAGLPIKELVIWGDESEYFNRIFYKYNFPLFTVASSHHFHPAQSGVFYMKEWDVRTSWKVYYFIRNKSFVFESRYSTALKARVAYYKFLVGFLGVIILKQKKDKFAKMKLLKMAAKDGFAKNTQKSIPEVLAIMGKI